MGDRVRDTMSGLTGRIVTFAQYATGCARCAIQAPVGQDSKVPDAYWTDVLSIELVEAAAPVPSADRSKGGPPAGYGLRAR